MVGEPTAKTNWIREVVNFRISGTRSDDATVDNERVAWEPPNECGQKIFPHFQFLIYRKTLHENNILSFSLEFP